MLNAILIAFQLILCVIVVVLVLLHSGKDAGMSSSSGFSFAAQASVMERNLSRYTITAGVVLFVNTFVLLYRL